MEDRKYSIDTKEIPEFTTLDYVLFGLMLAFSALIGLFYAIKDRRRSNTKEFLLAGGNMNPIPVALSILASFMSAITLLGTPAEMYNFTTMYFYIGLGYLLVVASAAHIFIPVFYKLRVTSAYEVPTADRRENVGVKRGQSPFSTEIIPEQLKQLQNTSRTVFFFKVIFRLKYLLQLMHLHVLKLMNYKVVD